jgi:hypothetical protein
MHGAPAEHQFHTHGIPTNRSVIEVPPGVGHAGGLCVGQTAEVAHDFREPW